MSNKKRCKVDSQVHRDAAGIVEYVHQHGGELHISHKKLGKACGIEAHVANGLYRVNDRRVYAALTHLKESVDANDRPCCGYRVHYKHSGPDAILRLIDPLDEHDVIRSGIETIRGWFQIEKRQLTENRRQVNVLETLAEQAFSNGDRFGYDVCRNAMHDLEKDGRLSAATQAELSVWLEPASA